MDKKLNRILYIELCYISSDWRIWRDENLQGCLINMIASALEISGDERKKAFHWYVDEETGNKRLLVHANFIPEYNRTYKHIKSVLDYAMGLANGMGYC